MSLLSTNSENPPQCFTDFALDISKNAAVLDKFFFTHTGIPRPSLDIGGPPAFPIPDDSAEVAVAREAILEASLQLRRLALGPIEQLMETTTSVSLDAIQSG
jgi:hypothetical protein